METTASVEATATMETAASVEATATMETAASVEATATEASTPTVETSTPAVKTSTPAATVTAMLGESRCRHTDESERRDCGENSLQQGGFPHFSPLSTLTAVGCPGGQPPQESYSIWTLVSGQTLPSLRGTD